MPLIDFCFVIQYYLYDNKKKKKKEKSFVITNTNWNMDYIGYFNAVVLTCNTFVSYNDFTSNKK